MKKFIFLFAAFVLCCSHDMFLKMDTYFLKPNAPATIKLFNGTFDKSENTISRSRMKDVSLVGHGTRSHPDTSQWTEMGHMTLLNFKTGAPGTWVAGLSTNANDIQLTAEEFNDYLDHDGVLDMLEWRKQNDALDKDAVEKYSKHVKAIFQVGEVKTNDWNTVLDYPIEFVPLSNPYSAKTGDRLEVKLLWNGQPVPNQLVYVGSDEEAHGHSHADGYGHDHDEAHTHEDEDDHHHDATRLRTDKNGIVSVDLSNEGLWYLRTIYMEHSEEEGLTHESNWATLTFEVGQGHGHTDGGHSHDGSDHSHGPGQGMGSYVYWIGGAILLAALFFWMSRKR